jgi:chromosome partitioning protein
VRIFAVINQKGGCGKTTTAINLAACFAELGRRTLLVDMDPQGHCGLGLAVPDTQLEHSIADVLMAQGNADFDFNDVLWQISARLDLAPSNVALAAVEQRLGQAPDRDRRLSKVLARVAGDYDICVIDCPPSIGLLTFNALRAAKEVVIPVETGYFALAGAVKQAATLQVLADRVGHEICLYVLPTLYDTRTNMAREIVAELRKHFGDRVLNIPIHYSSKLKEAASFGQPITEYDPASRGCQDYERLARHLLATVPKPTKLSSSIAAGLGVSVIPEPMPAEPVTVGQHIDYRRPAHLPPDIERPNAVPLTAAAAAAGSATPGLVIPSSPVHHNAPGHAGHPGSAGPPVPTVPSHPGSHAASHGNAMAPTGPVTPVRVPVSSRAAELVQRARALAERTSELQQRLASDPDVQRIERELGAQAEPPMDPNARRSLSQKLSEFYGVRITGQGALFVQPVTAGANRIFIAGDFNEWSPVATPMHRNHRLGVWQTCLPLPPGRYQYKLVVDGKWTADPHNQKTETNPFGEVNSVVIVA